MTTRIKPIRRTQPLDRETLDQILMVELELLRQELPDLQKFRDYLEGRQGEMVFETDKFKEEFGTVFAGFRDNWCAPVVDAVADKMIWEGIVLGADKDEQEANKELSRRLWDIFRENDIDEQQGELFESALTQGRAYAIAWPDEDLPSGVRIDWNPADLIRVRYADDDPRRIIWGMKRWLAPSGEIYITEYTRDFIYKWVENAQPMSGDTRTGIDAQRPTLAPTFSKQRREVSGEEWPLPNPFGVVPIVEFNNKRGSELEDVIPLQDAVNHLMLQVLSASGFEGLKQRVFFTGVREPTGGWSNKPGTVWQVKPDIDPDGKLIHGSAFEFSSADLNGLRGLVEMVLQHMALQTKAPVRMFFHGDRGGRGDAPSGESLLVEDQPLLDKVANRQKRFGNAGMRLAKLVALMADGIPNDIPLGEMDWHDPRSRYRTALIEEGATMVDKMGLPVRFVATQLGLSREEQALLMLELDAQEEKREREKDRELQAQRQALETRNNPNSPDTPADRE